MFSLASYTSLSWPSRRTIQWSLKGDPSCTMLMFCQAGEAKFVCSDENIFWWCGTNILFLIIPQNGAALEIRLTRAKFNHRVTGLGACILGYRVSYFLLLFSVSSHFLRDCKAMGGRKIMKCGKSGQRKNMTKTLSSLSFLQSHIKYRLFWFTKYKSWFLEGKRQAELLLCKLQGFLYFITYKSPYI